MFPSEDDKEIVDKLFTPHTTHSRHYISLAPCSKWFTKQLPKNISIEIIYSLIDKGYKVILIGGKDDISYCNEIESEAKTEMLLNMCGKLSPLQSQDVIEKSLCLISVDSAAAHIGASTGTPIVQIYGSTVPAFGFYPLTSQNVIVENKTLACRPCTDHGRNLCPLKHFKCMEELDTQEIINAVESLIKNS